MSKNPVVLELAALPREQVGPFLLLGLEKTADKDQIEASWARRIIWARKDQIKVALEDINWAREVLNDKDRRIRADAASLNLDTTDGLLRDLAERYGGEAAAARCKPLDNEKNLADFSLPVEMPDLEAVRSAIAVPDIPEEVPAVRGILEKFLQEPLDPWDLPPVNVHDGEALRITRMNDFSLPDLPRSPPAVPPEPAPSLHEITQGGSSLYRLFDAFIGLREKNERQHKLFEQALAKSRDAIQASFNSFAGDTQRAYQQLRQEIHGEKRISLVLLNELMEIGFDLEQIVAARPRVELPGEQGEAFARWADAIEVESRKVSAALVRHGIHRYDAVIGAPYNPAMHERVGGKRMEGMDALRVAEQSQHGFASQQPEFVLRRPKVLVTE